METNAPGQKQAPVRFSEELRRELAQPDPSGQGVKNLRDRLLRIVRGVKKKLGWEEKAREHGELKRFLAEVEEDELDLEIADLLSRYQKARVSSDVTKKAVRRVLDRVRKQYRRELAWSVRKQALEEAELANEPIFDNWLDEKVDDLEHLYSQGVIDPVEYFFLLAKREGFDTKVAAQLIKWNESTAYTCLFYARKKVQTALEDLNAGRPLRPKSTRGRRRQKVDEDTLYHAIWYVLTR